MQAQIQKWKDDIGPKGLRALERLTVKLMPDMQAALLSRFGG